MAGIFPEAENVEDSGWRVTTAGAEVRPNNTTTQLIARRRSLDFFHELASGRRLRRVVEKADIQVARSNSHFRPKFAIPYRS